MIMVRTMEKERSERLKINYGGRTVRTSGKKRRNQCVPGCHKENFWHLKSDHRCIHV